MTQDGSYRVESFATNVDAEIRRLNAQVDLFWAAEGELLVRYGLCDGMTLLDCGCGPGRLIELIKGMNPSVRCTGLDMDPILVEVANRKLQESGLSDCKVAQGTAESSGLSESAFDFILLRLVLEHVPDPVGALKSLARLLKPGGRMVVIDNDFDLHLRTFPPVPQLDTLYEAYRASRRKDGGDPCIGRRLPELLGAAGLHVAAYEIEVAHNAVLGDGPFLKAEGAGIPAKLVSTGFLDGEVLEDLTRNWLAMLSTPGHAIVRQLFVAVGERPGVGKIAGPKNAAVSSKPAAGISPGSGGGSPSSVLPASGSLELLLELLPVALDKGPVAAGDSLPALGVDSLAALSLQDMIRERTGVELPIVKILEDVTVEELAKLLLDEREKRKGPVEGPPAGSSGRMREEEI